MVVMAGASWPFNQRVCDSAKSQRRQGGANPVQLRGSLIITAFRHSGSQQNDRQRKWKIQEKDPTPCEVFDQPAADDWPNSRSNGGEPRPGPNCLTSCVFGKGRCNQCKASGYQ